MPIDFMEASIYSYMPLVYTYNPHSRFAVIYTRCVFLQSALNFHIKHRKSIIIKGTQELLFHDSKG
jgi:hypothetical protein